MSVPQEIVLDDWFEWHVNTHNPSTGAETDADASPTYRLYEENVDAPIVAGSLAKRDDVNTVGYYFERLQASSENNIEVGKLYFIRTRAIVGGVAASHVDSFKVVANGAPSADQIADAVLEELISEHWTNADSLAGALRLVRGLAKRNFVLDNTTFNSKGLLTVGRLRLFDTKAAAGAATDGGSGEGEFAALTISGVAEDDNAGRLKIGKVVLE